MCSQPGLLLNKKPRSKNKQGGKNVSAIVLCLWPAKRVSSHTSEHFQYLLKFMSVIFAHEVGQEYTNDAEVPLM